MIPQIEDHEVTPDVEKTAERSRARIQVKSIVLLESAIQRIGEKVMDPATSTRTLQDAAEFFYKTSGMASKQAEKPQGPAFRLVIDLGDSGKSITLESPGQDTLGEAPKYLSTVPIFNSDLIVDE